MQDVRFLRLFSVSDATLLSQACQIIHDNGGQVYLDGRACHIPSTIYR